MTLLAKFRTSLCICIVSGFLPIIGATIVSAQPPQTAAEAEKIVREASWNELHSSGPPHFFRYRISEQDPNSSDVKLVIQTRNGTVARMIEKGGRPLSAADNAAEIARLRNLQANPEIQQRRHKRESLNSNREDELVRMLPDAFLYVSEGVIQGPSGPLLPAKLQTQSGLYSA